MKPTFLTAAVLGGLLLGSITQASAHEAKPVIVAPEAIPSKIVGSKIHASLTGGAKTSAKAGRKTVVNRKQGNCLACHVIPGKEAFMGNIGPSLAGVAARMNAAEMRLQIVNPKVNNPDTIMPGFYIKDFPGTLKKFKGKTIMSAQQIEDTIAYLLTLK